MNRRKFIKNSSTLAIPVFINGMLPKAFGSPFGLNQLISNAANDHVLVLVQLFGGNDGLNTLVPLSQYDPYYKARQKLAINKNKVLPLSGITTSGLHPSLQGLRDLYDTGKLSIIQSVGYPAPNFSHFRSSDIWMSGSDASQVLDTGWMGRYLDQLYPGYPQGYPKQQAPDPLAIQIGTTTSFAFQGYRSPMSVNVVNPEQTSSLVNGFNYILQPGPCAEALSFVNMVSQQSASYGDVLRKAALSVMRQSAYPEPNSLATDLKTVARLIKSGLQTKVYLVSFEGFDTHAQQANENDSSTGRHADLLRTVGDAIQAFQRDLEFLGIQDRVMGMTFSEFGRRIASNDSLGTDHGAAAPLFVFGAKVKGGILGKDPVIPEKATTEDNIPMQYDFRSVYTSVLQNWLGVTSSDVRRVLQKEYEVLPFL